MAVVWGSILKYDLTEQTDQKDGIIRSNCNPKPLRAKEDMMPELSVQEIVADVEKE
jgi:hypothetical protein